MKRFTDTLKWHKGWYRKAIPRVKCLWVYLCDNCDHAGVLDADWELISFFVGEPVSETDLAELNGNAVMRSGKIFLPQFVEFQYSSLNRACKPHAPVFEAIERHGLSQEELFQKPFNGLSKDIQSEQVQEKEKEKEKDRGSTRGSAEQIYALYPRKVARPDALRAIQKAMAAFGFEFLFERTQAYAAAVNGKDPQFIPHPSTWFNQERFNDAPETWKQNGAKPAQSISELKAVLLSKQSIETELREKYATQGPLGLNWNDKAKQAQWKGLRHEIRELNQRIATMA